MLYPTTCPQCGNDLTQDGAAGMTLTVGVTVWPDGKAVAQVDFFQNPRWEFNPRLECMECHLADIMPIEPKGGV